MITISNLNFAYPRCKLLLDKLSLEFRAGHIYGLLGKNGSGKSTLLHLLSGLLCPVSGTLLINKKEPFQREISFLQDLFLMPEEFYVPGISIKKYVNLFASFYPRFNHPFFEEILNDFEVFPTDNIHKMSMGQRKKALMSFALASNTKILLMDEPTNGLDIPSKFQFRKILSKMDISDKCIIISTHQVKDLDKLIDSIVILEDQKISFQNNMKSISESLSFITYNENECPESFLYKEEGFGGGKVIIKNESGKPTLVDMELLFNALICERESIMDALRQKE